MKNIEIISITNAYTAQRNNIETMKKENKQVKELKLPAAVAWKRRVNLDKLFHAKELIETALNEVKEKYADDKYSIEKENVREVKPEYVKEFIKEQDDILAQQTDVDIKKVNLSDIKDIILTDDDMDTLAFMIKEDQE